MERKKLFEALVAVAFAMIFIISYASIGNFGAVASSTTTAVAPPTLYAYGFANAMVYGYSPQINVTVKCSNSSESNIVISKISNATADLESNNSVSTYYTIGRNITIGAGSENSLQIYGYLYGKLNASESGCSRFASAALIVLPPVVTFNVESQKIPIAISNASSRSIVPINFSGNMSLVIPVRVAAFITTNEVIYGNVSITRV